MSFSIWVYEFSVFCCPSLRWVRPFARLGEVSVLVFLVGVFCMVWNTRSLQHTDFYYFLSHCLLRFYLKISIWNPEGIYWYMMNSLDCDLNRISWESWTPSAISSKSEFFFLLRLDLRRPWKMKNKGRNRFSFCRGLGSWANKSPNHWLLIYIFSLEICHTKMMCCGNSFERKCISLKDF